MVFAESNGQLEYEQKHVYAGSERIEQFTDKGNWERTLYVHEDVMGNTRYYTKANGQSFAELTYDAWGMPESPNKLLNNDHGNYVFATFTGHIYDTTLDIYFAEARFYDANNRIWLAMDPIKDGLNWYQYCYSNPTTYYDPLGLWGTTTGSKQAQLCGSSEMNARVMGFMAAIGVNLAESSIPPIFYILDYIGWGGNYGRVSGIEMRIANAENRFRLTYSQDDVAYYEGRKAGNYVIAGIGIYMGAKGLAGIAGGIHKELIFTGGFTGGGVLVAETAEVIVISSSGTVAADIFFGIESVRLAHGKLSGNNRNTNVQQLKKIGSNAEANEIVGRFGYDSAEDFKEAYVGKNAISKFNIKINPSTKEIVLEAIRGGLQIPTGYYVE